MTNETSTYDTVVNGFGGDVTSGMLSVMAVTVTVITVAAAVITFTVFGNILIIMSVVQYPPLRSVPNIFIVSLAVADLMVAVGVLPLNVVYNVTGAWLFGSVACKLWLTCDVMCCTASILNLCAIALDRYRAITQPIAYAQKRTAQRVMGTVALVWLASAAISSPPLIGWNDWPDVFDERTPCTLTANPGYVVYSSMGSFYIPLAVMSVTYLKIYLATRRRLRRRAKQGGFVSSSSSSTRRTTLSRPECSGAVAAATTVTTTAATTTATTVAGGGPSYKREADSVSVSDELDAAISAAGSEQAVPDDGRTATGCCHVDQLLERKQRISLSRERKAAKTLGVIMGVFVVCWLPFFAVYLFFPLCRTCRPPSKLVVTVVTWLGYLNSTVNPIIYTRCNKDFRRSFQKILHLDRRRPQRY